MWISYLRIRPVGVRFPPSLEDGRGALRQFYCTPFAQNLLSNVLNSCSVVLVPKQNQPEESLGAPKFLG